MYLRLPTHKKIEIVKRIIAGESVAKISRETHYSRTILYKWYKQYTQVASRSKATVLESHPPQGKEHWKKLPQDITKKIIKTALDNPSFSADKIGQIIGVSGHGVWNVLKDNHLNTFQDRQVYLQQLKNRTIKEPLVDDKVTMIRRFEAGEKIAEICREFGTSRTTFYKWYKRYLAGDRLNPREILENQRPKGEKHWRYYPEAQQVVLKIILDNPQLTPKKIAEKLRLSYEKPILGSHGVYNLLKRLNLNLASQRLAYARVNTPATTVQPAASWVDKLQTVFNVFTPSRAAAPPPSSINLLKSFLFSFFFSFCGYFLLGLWTRIYSQAPAENKVGIIFATLALLSGSIFFIYSIKYYLTLALVLGFSRHTGESGENGGNGTNGNGGKSWLSKILGGNSSSGKGYIGGLQTNLDQITLTRQPFVSIHLAVYNERKVVNRLLTACTSMDYPNFEVIVVDDST
ncbi:MAG: helix-turn-helix domain-containing protein, partial [Candidatus Gottesmanbacteria bacterium]